MKTELSRRTLLQIPLLAAVSVVPSISAGNESRDEWKLLVGFRARMPLAYTETSDNELELRPWKIWHQVPYRDGEFDRDHHRQLQHLEWLWKTRTTTLKPTIHHSWPARNTDKSDPLGQHGIYVQSSGYSRQEFAEIVEKEMQVGIQHGEPCRYFMYMQTPFMPTPTRT